jgi:hypothetical protein
MQIKKTLTEAAVILIIFLLLSIIFCIVSPTGRILLKKGLRIKNTPATSLIIMANRSGP